MQAARTTPEIAKILMDAGASHEAGHPVGHSPLSLALETGNLPVAKFFLETGADPNVDNGVCWEFYKAATVTQTEAARLLVDYINVDQAVQDPDDYGLLQVGAAAVGFVDLMKQLLEHCRFAPEAESSIRAFDWAICYGHLDMVKLLLDHGADPDANADTEPPIYVAMDQGRDEIESDIGGRVASIHFAVVQGEAVFRLLLQHGIRLEPGRPEHQKALASAAFRADVPILKIFLDAGFDIESRDPSPRNDHPSLLARVTTADDREAAEAAVDLLLAHEANIKGRDPQTDLTPLLHVCSITGNEMNARPHARAIELNRQAAQLLLKKGANLLFINNYDASAIALAAEQGHLSIVKTLLNFWKEQDTPFDQIKPLLLAAIAPANDADLAKTLSNFYWPRVYSAK